MQTPWGNLTDLDLNDRKLAEEILLSDKHQLVEGLVVECLFDQFLSSLPKSCPRVIALDVETVIAQPKRRSDRKIAIVWARSKTEGLGRYLSSLEKCFDVFVIEFRSGRGFVGSRISKGQRDGGVRFLDELLEPIAARPYTPFGVSDAVRQEARQKEAIWGFLFAHHQQDVASRVLLPRLLMNCGVQPWFRYIWNLDRIFLVDGKPWLFEVKHKFPFSKDASSPLYFGLNNGELSTFRELSACGIGTAFSIMVKPKWSKTVGSLYMLTDLAARSRTAVIGKVLNQDIMRRMAEKPSGISGSDTTITGEAGSSLRFKRLPAREFGMFGRFSDEPSGLAQALVAEIRGLPVPRVEDAQLRVLQMAI